MKLAVCGSIATDLIFHFPGNFTDQFLEGHMHKVSLSFLVDDMDVHRGGVGPNITYGMAQLGANPLLVGSAGNDFDEYQRHLETAGVDCSGVRRSERLHTATCTITTDAAANQLVTFYGGAMAEAREIDLPATLAAVGGADLVLISADDPEAMVRHTQACRDQDIAFVADPSQQLTRMDGEQIKLLIDGAKFLITNGYEAELMEHKTGWSRTELGSRVDVQVITHGADGVELCRNGEAYATVASVATEGLVDPTGAGDAFRGGLFTAVAAGLDLPAACEVGATLATTVLETTGTQEYVVAHDTFFDRLGAAYAPQAASAARTALGV